ncbi:MAG: hypothetical protein U5L03_07935 [Burkholderiaceae bacterium]|nr:hypothetical protein [Burkholderiaceae bacterium]
MRLQDEKEHPHGLSNAEFDSLFTTSKPIVFAYHGYPWAHPPPDLPADATTGELYVCAATRRRAPPPRRSTWSCSTTSTASTSSST